MTFKRFSRFSITVYFFPARQIRATRLQSTNHWLKIKNPAACADFQHRIVVRLFPKRFCPITHTRITL